MAFRLVTKAMYANSETRQRSTTATNIPWHRYINILLLVVSVTCKRLEFAEYKDNSKDALTPKLNEVCKEEWTPTYGGNGGETTRVECPNDGIITNINYSFDKDESKETVIRSISFECTSSLGINETQMFGKTGMFESKLNCENENFHISYFKGKYTNYVLRELEVKCVKTDETKSDNVQRNSMRNIEEHNREIKAPPVTDVRWTDDEENSDFQFDNKCYTIYGGRPVAINVYADETSLVALSIRYRNVPVRQKCAISHVEIMDNLKFVEDHFEVLGFTSGSTCSNLTQQLNLDVAQTRTFSFENNKLLSGGDFRGIPIRLKSTMGSKHNYEFMLDLSREIGVLDDSGESSTYAFSLTNEMQYVMGTTINYDGPGVALVVGLRIVYKPTMAKVLVRNHYTCELGGSKPPTATILEIEKNEFGNVFFLDHQFVFESPEECLDTSYPQECVSSLRITDFITDLDELERSFHRCFSKKAMKIPFG